MKTRLEKNHSHILSNYEIDKDVQEQAQTNQSFSEIERQQMKELYDQMIQQSVNEPIKQNNRINLFLNRGIILLSILLLGILIFVFFV